jgi:hypothetical protein
MILTIDWLDEYCLAEPTKPLAAHYIAEYFGALAPWWLPQSLLSLATEACPPGSPRERAKQCWIVPSPGEGRGDCTVVFVKIDDGNWRWRALRPAVALPLTWKENSPSSNRLPKGLAEVADSVLKSIGDRIPRHSWGLHLSSRGRLDDCDLSGVSFRSESAWAPLAAGLWAAAHGGVPRSDVWGTGAWDAEQGVQNVCGIPQKLELMCEFGARVVYLPAQNRQDADRWKKAAGAEVNIGELPNATLDIPKVLEDYVEELETPPDCSAEQQKRVNWYEKVKDRKRADRYYDENLLPDLILRLREQAKVNPLLQGISHLITVFNPSNPNLFRLVLEPLRPQHCLMFRSPESTKADTTEVERVAVLLGCKLRFQDLSIQPDRLDECRKALDGFVAEISPGQLAVDLTAGKKLMSVTLAQAAPCDSRLLYLETECGSNNKPRPFSEKFWCWTNRMPQAAGHLD